MVYFKQNKDNTVSNADTTMSYASMIVTILWKIMKKEDGKVDGIWQNEA